MRRGSLAFLMLQLGLLAGCYPKADLRQPVPSETIAAPMQPAKRLVVVLPGRSDDLAALRRSGIAAAIQTQWPDADVVLAGMALNHYIEGRAPQRLHDEVIAPARQHRAYRETWLVGASLGGMGSLLYDRAYPGDITGMVLLAPYLGEAPLLGEIEAAGGLAKWNAGPVPATLNGDNFTREIWRHVQGWQRDPAQVRNVWLGHGQDDYLRRNVPLITPALPAGHVLSRPGAHVWKVWTPLAGEILSRAGPKTLD